MFSILPNVAIRAVSVAVPEHEIRLEDELEYYDGSMKKAERARAMIGIDRRRIAFPGQTASDLCAAAAVKLFCEVPEAHKADALVFVTQSPDFDFPATACILQDKLGLSQDCASFDVNQGCAGYIYGLWIASNMISSGSCKNVLLLAGDVPYRARDTNNRIISPIFGDGGSATLLSFDSNAENLTFCLKTNGKEFADIIMVAGRSRVPFSPINEENNIFFKDIIDNNGSTWRLCETYMDGHAVFNFTMRVIPQHITDFLTRCGVAADDLDYAVLHQANAQIVNTIGRKAGLPKEKTPTAAFSKYGNLSSASIPCALCDLFSSTGSISNRRLLLCGFGVGLAWGSCLWKSEHCICLPICDVKKTKFSKEENVNFWKMYIEGNKNGQ